MRSDDDLGKIGKRIEAFSARPNPVKDHLQGRKQPFFSIDGEAEVDEVQSRFIECVQAILQRY